MGYNTVVLVLNDRLSEIENNPKFGAELVAAIRHHSPSNPDRAPYVTGQTQVISIDHSGGLQIVAIGGNTGKRVGTAFTLDLMNRPDALIAELAEQKGIAVRKRKAKVPA